MNNSYGGSRGIPFLSGGVDPSVFEDITHNIKKMINPNYDTEEAFKKFIQANPDKLQAYVDLSQTNPEAFGSLGLGKIGQKMVSSGKLSADAKIKMAADKALSTPQGQIEAGAKAAGTQTPEQRVEQQKKSEYDTLRISSEKMQQTYQGLQTDVLSGKIKENDAMLAYKPIFKDFQAKLPKGASKNLYEQFQTGILNPAMKQSIYQDPELKAMYDKDVESYFQKEQDRISRARLNKDIEGQDFLLQSRKAWTTRMSELTNNPDINSIFNMTDPKKMSVYGSIYDKLRQKPTMGAQENPDVLEQRMAQSVQDPNFLREYQAYKGIRQYTDQVAAKDKQKLLTQRRLFQSNLNSSYSKAATLLSQYRKGDAKVEDVQAAVDSYKPNLALAFEAGLEAPDLNFDPNSKELTWTSGSKTYVASGAPNIRDMNAPISQEDNDARAIDILAGAKDDAEFASMSQELKAANPATADKVISEAQKKRGVRTSGAKADRKFDVAPILRSPIKGL